ncbi:MAG: 50S ribosomal protein L9 [Flavobacteriales bacterium]
MEIILKEDVEGLGYKGDLLDVKPGYGRNYLIPRGIAVLATSFQKKVWEENKRQSQHKEEKLLKEAENMRDAISKLDIKVGAKVSETGKIFGSITTLQIAESLAGMGLQIDRKSIELKDENIKQAGKYKADIKLHKDISFSVEFEVVGE